VSWIRRPTFSVFPLLVADSQSGYVFVLVVSFGGFFFLAHAALCPAIVLSISMMGDEEAVCFLLISFLCFGWLENLY